jgi:cell division protein FtsW
MASATMRKSDIWLGITVFGLTIFGIIMIYSASVITGHILFHDDTYFVKRQLVWAVLGGVGSIVMANIDYHVWKQWAGWMLGITLLLLASVFLFRTQEINGAHRWIILFGQSFQPSELAKLTFIIYLSAWLVERKQEVGDIVHTFLPYLGVLLIITLLMLKQPDFGTLTIILVPAMAIYFVAGLTWKQILLGITILVIGLALSFTSSYRRDRLNTFLHPGTVTSSTSYHTKEIAIAIGSGGLRGLGFGESKQKRLFLPEPYTDSIFAIITEELGYVWSEVLILVFCFLLYRGYMVAARSADLFGRLLAVGITSWFAFQTFINLGSMVRLVPLVGVPLPFISFGGTNLVISLLAVGLLVNISRYGVVQETGTRKNKKKG